MSDFLFVLLIVLLVFGVFRRWIAFFILGAVSKKLMKEMSRMAQQQQEQFSRQQQSKQQGNVHVEGDTRQRKSSRDDRGDYVDFEEVKD
jgi:UPF0716 family protein affecting phage T7 exclusion